jgi:hypothetical protein
LLRKAAKIATVVVTLKQYTDEKGAVHVDTFHPGVMGFEGMTEKRTLNGSFVEEDDRAFGKKKAYLKWVKLEDIKDPFLKKEWLPEAEETGLIASHEESLAGKWTSDQVS